MDFSPSPSKMWQVKGRVSVDLTDCLTRSTNEWKPGHNSTSRHDQNTVALRLHRAEGGQGEQLPTPCELVQLLYVA